MIENQYRQEGFTLVELMIASGIGIFLMGAILQVFSQSKTTVVLNQSLTEIQDSGRSLLGHMSFNLKQRGYQGCLPPAALDIKDVDSIDWYNETSVTPLAASLFEMPYSQTALLGYEVNGSGAFTPAPVTSDMKDLQNGRFSVKPRPQSDVVHVEYGDRRGVNLSAEMNNELSGISIQNNVLNFKAGDLVMVGDCTGADIVQITSISSSGGMVTLEHAAGINRNARLSKVYDASAQVRKFHYFTYFVADTGRKTQSGETVYSLYRADHLKNTVELATGVEFLQLSYKQESSLGVQDLTAAHSDFNPMKVTGAELGLLISGHKSILMNNDAKVYRLPGASIGPNQKADYGRNKLLKSPFRTHIDIKNRA